MELSNSENKKGSMKSAAGLYRRAVELLVNKALFLTVLVSVFFSTFLLRKGFSEICTTVWFTADGALIGNRPGRLFGLLSLLGLSMNGVRIVLYVIYVIAVIFASFAMYLLIREIKDNVIKILVLLAALIFIMGILDQFKVQMWDLASLPLFISFTLALWAFRFLILTDMPYLAPVFIAAAQFIDCRTLVYALPVMVLVIFLRPLNKDRGLIKKCNLISLAAATLILIVSFVTVDFASVTDSEEFDPLFVERYAEMGIAAENVDRTDYAFKFEAYTRVTPQELFSDSITGISCLEDIVFLDHFQRAILIFMSACILYICCGGQPGKEIL